MAVGGKLAWFAMAILFLPLEGQTAPRPALEACTVTLPFTLDHNRMIVDVEFLRPDGSRRKARAWVDTGSPKFMIAEPLARDLGLNLALEKEGHPGSGGNPTVPAPTLWVGGMRLDTEGLRASISPGPRVMPGLPAEANLPASALRGHHVVLDYPMQRLTLAAPGLLKPQGTAIPCRVNAETGLFLVTATLDGERVQLGVDNGSAGTWLSDKLAEVWASRHPDWPRSYGAAGSTNFFGFTFETKGCLMRLPELRLGPAIAKDISLLALDQSFFDWYSKKSAGPVQGFIGANVLKGFRLEIDFPAQMTYWKAGRPLDPDDLDMVGITLRPETNGRTIIAGVVHKARKPWVEDLREGDALLQVDELRVQDATMGMVITALRGKPGAKRVLTIERDGKTFKTEAKVARLP